MTTVVDRRALTDAKFVSSLQSAFQAECAVAVAIARRGAVEITLPTYRVRPAYEQRSAYRDDGDLRMRWPNSPREYRVEVKWRTVNFLTPQDYPYDTAFVDEVVNLDAKNPRPDYYFLCNKALTACLVVNLARAQLDTIDRHDSRYGGQLIRSYVVDPLQTEGWEL